MPRLRHGPIWSLTVRRFSLTANMPERCLRSEKADQVCGKPRRSGRGRVARTARHPDKRSRSGYYAEIPDSYQPSDNTDLTILPLRPVLLTVVGRV